jgi:type II secretory pathway pseudopilin PulG
MRVPGGEGTSVAGYCWVDVLLAMAIAALVAAMAVPLTARSVDTLRARDAAGFVTARIRAARQQAVASGRGVALVFDETDRGWTVRVCRDGNGNGVRRAEIESRRDECFEGPWRLSDLFPTVRVERDPSLPGLDDEVGGGGAVRFGHAAMVSCSASGGCTAGTLFVRSGSGEQFAIRVSGVAGRTRLLTFDRGTYRWAAA